MGDFPHTLFWSKFIIFNEHFLADLQWKLKNILQSQKNWSFFMLSNKIKSDLEEASGWRGAKKKGLKIACQKLFSLFASEIAGEYSWCSNKVDAAGSNCKKSNSKLYNLCNFPNFRPCAKKCNFFDNFKKAVLVFFFLNWFLILFNLLK